MPKHPHTVDVREAGIAEIQRLALKHGLAGRSGGRESVDRALARAEAIADPVETHVDDAALDDAARACAVAFLKTHRAIREHADADCSDRSLNRVAVLLAEALAVLECNAHLNIHRDRIAFFRANAPDPAVEALPVEPSADAPPADEKP